jgi:hypothetical protein
LDWGLIAYALGGDDFAVGGGAPLGEPLPDRCGCCCCCAGALGGTDEGALKGDGAVLCAVGDAFDFVEMSAL